MDAQHLTHLGASALTYNSWRAGGGKGLGASDSAPRTYSNPYMKSWIRPALLRRFKACSATRPSDRACRISRAGADHGSVRACLHDRREHQAGGESFPLVAQ